MALYIVPIIYPCFLYIHFGDESVGELRNISFSSSGARLPSCSVQVRSHPMSLLTRQVRSTRPTLRCFKQNLHVSTCFSIPLGTQTSALQRGAEHKPQFFLEELVPVRRYQIDRQGFLVAKPAGSGLEGSRVPHSSQEVLDSVSSVAKPKSTLSNLLHKLLTPLETDCSEWELLASPFPFLWATLFPVLQPFPLPRVPALSTTCVNG